MRDCIIKNKAIYLPTDQGEDGDAECQDAYDNTRDRHEHRKTKEKEEQQGAPTSYGTRHSHFTRSY